MKNKITIVCCYNDRKQYERLQASLAKQNTGYELIGMDNCHGQYASCSLALNAATARVETEYVIYAHQDVELPKEDTLARFAGYLAQTGEADLLGVAGIVGGAIFQRVVLTIDSQRKKLTMSQPYREYSTAKESLPQPASRHFPG